MSEEEKLLNVIKEVSELMRHARANNEPEALTLTNALATLQGALCIMREAKGEDYDRR